MSSAQNNKKRTFQKQPNQKPVTKNVSFAYGKESVPYLAYGATKPKNVQPVFPAKYADFVKNKGKIEYAPNAATVSFKKFEVKKVEQIKAANKYRPESGKKIEIPTLNTAKIQGFRESPQEEKSTINFSKTTRQKFYTQPALQESNPQPTKPQQKPAQKDRSLSLLLTSINNKQINLVIDQSKTGLELKQYIFASHCEQLQVKRMSLFYNQTEIYNWNTLADLNLDGSKVHQVRQTKTELTQVSNIKVVDQEDQITLERFVAVMSCGHKIGTSSMNQLVKDCIKSGSYRILCPHLGQNNQPCRKQWDFGQCKRVGIFTAEECKQFSNGLSEQYLKQFCKNCPSCQAQVFKDELNTNRVACPYCQSPDFCYLCLKQWNGTSTCGNEECLFASEYLFNSPWTKVLSLKDLADEGKYKEYLTPQNRACPQCFYVITHDEGCKHMTCKYGCNGKFCWVCLAVPNQGGEWPCKGAFDYCGSVAPVQAKISK